MKRGHTVYQREYQHDTGTFSEHRPVRPENFVVISGLHPFYLPKMRELIDVKIYLDTFRPLRTHWKIMRDCEARQYQKDKVLELIRAREEDARKYILPQKGFANIVVRYFTHDDFIVGDTDSKPQLKLEITLDTDSYLEDILMKFAQEGIDIQHDYADDLHTQSLVLEQPVPAVVIDSIARSSIENIEDLLPSDYRWLSDHRGFVQFVILVILSEKLKDGHGL